MAGNVVVDDVEEAEETPLRLPSGWVLGLGAAVVLVLVLLPGQPDSPATPTTVSVPEVVLNEERWRPFDLPGAGGLFDVTRLVDGSYIAVGDGPQVWRYDGQSTWEWVLEDTVGSGTLASVTPYADGAASWWSVAGGVAVGFDDLDGSVTEAAIWKSSDSRSWTRVPIDVGRPSGLDGISSAGKRLVAWGWGGSSRNLAPEAEPLVLQSTDGENWTELDGFADESARFFIFTRRLDKWYAAGYATGRPAVWESGPDLDSWTTIDTGELPFGWAVVDLRWETVDPDDGVSLVATLVHLSGGRARRWAHENGAWVALEERPGNLVIPAETDSTVIGVGGGSLWTSDEGDWETIDLTGQVAAAAGKIAVGSSLEGQPRVWIEDGDDNEGTAIPMGTGGRWEPRRELPGGNQAEAWRVAGGWVMGGTEEAWSFLGPDGEERFTPPWGDRYYTIVGVADEWVALPSMHWTSNGIDWEQRAHPWGDGEPIPAVEAVAEVDGRILAVGRDSSFLWNVAVSDDGGHTWAPLDDPAPATPVWDVVGTSDGFVATAARTQGTEEVVRSRDGRNWESLMRGALLPGTQPPAAITPDGTLFLFDSGEEVQPPRTDISALTRTGGGLLIVAGGSMWLGGEEWVEIPLDPPHGMAAAVADPVPIADRLLAVGFDRGHRLLYEWEP